VTSLAFILGLDVSERRIGWALVDYDSAKPVNIGTIHTPIEDDLEHRVDAWRAISHTATTAGGDIEAVILEAPYTGPNKQGSLRAAMAIGNLAGIAASRLPTSVLIDTIQPATWRTTLRISTRGKTAPLNHARSLCNDATLTDQDAADALCIATAAHTLIWRNT
jgi:Holliday junction resolvasome RuvABC endonuclease subunit